MSQDSGSSQEASPTRRLLEGRHGRLEAERRDPRHQRRANLAQVCEDLGFDGIAARIETAPDAICLTRMSDGAILALNDRCEEVFGYSFADHAGKTVDEIRFWDDLAGREVYRRALRRSGEVTTMETRLRRRDGSAVPVLLSGRALDVHGDTLILSVAHDITERKRAEEALRRSEEHYRAIVTTMDDAVLLVGPDRVIASVNPSAERILGHPAADLVGQSLEVRMRTGGHIRMDGSPLPVEEHPAFTVLRDGAPRSHCVIGINRPDATRVWISVNSVALAFDGKSEKHGALLTFRDITDRVIAEGELKRREADLERLLKERDANLAAVRSSLAAAVRVIGEVVETRDPYTAGHQRRVAELATRIAHEMRLPAAQVDEIRVAALVHDVGKMAIPIEILNKPGPLSALQFSLVKSHAEAGYLIVSSAGMNGDAASIVRQHHERCDGSGYPRGLSGEALHLGAKVLMVADVVEAMASHRPYRMSLGLDAALEEIEEGAGNRYDAEVCKACTSVVRAQDFAFTEPQAN